MRNSESAVIRSGRLSELYPEIRTILEQGKPVSIGFQGTSMVPTLRGGRDRVILVLPKEKLRKYDLPLYRRDDGSFVLHRIVSVAEDGSYTCCGDHQWRVEKGIRQEQILAVADQIVRKGRLISVHSFGYRLYVRLWCLCLPARSVLIRGVSALRRFFHRK